MSKKYITMTNPEKKDRSERATVFKTKRAKTTRSPTASRKDISQKTKSKTMMKSKKLGSPSVMGGGGERSKKSAPDRSRKTSPDDHSDKSQKIKRAPNRTILKIPPSLNLVSVQKAKTMMNRSKKPSDRSRKYQQPQQKAVSVLKVVPSLNLVSVQGKKGDRYTVMKTRMQSIAKKQSVFPSTRKTQFDGNDGGSIAIGTSLMTEAVPSPPPTVFSKKTGAIKVLDTESLTSTTDPSRTGASQAKSRRKLTKGEQTTFDFLTPKSTRSTQYATSTRRPGARRNQIVPCVCLIALLAMLVGALVVWMFGAASSERKTTSSTSTSTASVRSTTTDLPPIEIAIPVELDTSTTTTVSTTTVTYTTAAKRPPLNIEALKEACGSPCWYYPDKFATSCQSIECHSVELYVGEGLRGQANYSFYVIKQSAPLTRRSTFVPEGTPCKPPGRPKVGVCSGRQCVDIIDQSDYVKFDQYESDRVNGEWTTFGRYKADSGSCLVSHDFFKAASQLLKPKYTNLCSSQSPTKICYSFMIGFRSCTKKYPANGGKQCFEIDRSSGWLKVYDQNWPVGIRECPICKDKKKWPPARPLDFKPDCRHRFADEYSCHLANGDFSDGDDDALAVSDFDYCCNGNELGRCLLGTCTPLL